MFRRGAVGHDAAPGQAEAGHAGRSTVPKFAAGPDGGKVVISDAASVSVARPERFELPTFWFVVP